MTDDVDIPKRSRAPELLVGVIALVAFISWLVALVHSPQPSAVHVAVMADRADPIAVRVSAVIEKTLSRVPFEGTINGVRVVDDIARVPIAEALVVEGTVDARPVKLSCPLPALSRRHDWVPSLKPGLLGVRKLEISVENDTLHINSPHPQALGIDVVVDGVVRDVFNVDASETRMPIDPPEGDTVVVHAAPPVPGARGAWALVGKTPPAGKEPARLRADALECASTAERDDTPRLAFLAAASLLLLSVAVVARKAVVAMIVSVVVVGAVLAGLYVALLIVAL